MARLVPGTLIADRYRVIVPLPPWQHGAALARDERLGQQVDLVVAPDPAGTPRGDLFMRRAQITGTLHHPALPVVCDITSHDRYPVLVRRHIDGQPLSQLLAAGEATASKLLGPISDAARALDLIHTYGLCHGSLSAESVLVDAEGNAVLTDLVWPYGTGSLPTLSPDDDIAVLRRLLTHALNALAASENATAECAAWTSRSRALSQLRFATAAEVHNAVAQLIAGNPSAFDAPRASSLPARPAMRRQRHPTAQRGGRANALAVALLIGAAMTLLPGVEALAYRLHGPAPFMHWHMHDEWGPRPWDDAPFRHHPWTTPPQNMP